MLKFHRGVLGSALVGASALCLATSASADGMPSSSYYAPRPFNWTGFYIGGHLGDGYGHVDTINVAPTEHVFHLKGTGEALRPDGLIGGGQLGYNVQLGHWVFGIEGSISASRMRDTQTHASNIGCNVMLVPCTVVATAEIGPIYAATAKLGYSWGQLLPYVSGGYAGAKIDTGRSEERRVGKECRL